jgi:Fe-S cluster assembly ATP-binding protein
MAILDDPDSGLDIDAVRIVGEGITAVRQQQPETGLLLITHYERILKYVRPDTVHVMVNGRIVETAGAELVQELESVGYDKVMARLAAEGAAEEASVNGR